MNSSQKWSLSLLAGLLFVVVSLPWTYQGTNYVFKHLKLDTISSSNSNLTVFGLTLHFIVFVLLFRLMFLFYPNC
jgi:uncharacterized BrkB/YihY/UPF0761 family membrane protein